MLNKIIVENFRGDSWIQDLTGYDIITGGNFSGKTSRILAITFGIFGKLPGFPSGASQLYEALYKTEGDGIIRVTLEFQKKEVVRIKRTFTRKRGKVTRALDVAFRDGSELKQLAKSTEGYNGIQNLIIVALKPTLEAFSLNVFRTEKKSGPEREKELLALFGELAEGDSEGDKAVSKTYLEQTEDGDEDTRNELIAEAMNEWDIDKDWPEALEAVETKLREIKNDNAADRRTAEASQKELATMPLDETIGNLAELEAELATLNARKDVINREIGEEETRIETHEGWAEQCDQLKKAITKLETGLVELQKEQVSLDDAEIQRQTLALESLKADHEIATGDHDVINLDWGKLNEELQGAKLEVTRLLEKVAALHESRDNLRDGNPMICNFMQEPCDIITVEHINALIKNAATERDAAVAGREAKGNEVNEITPKLMAAEQVIHKLDKEITAAETGIETTTNRAEEVDGEIIANATATTEEQEKLKRLEDTRPPLGEVNIELLNGELEGLNKNIKAKNAIKENTIRKQERETQTLELGIKIENAEIRNEVLKALLVKIKEIRAQFKSTLDERIRETLSRLKPVSGDVTFRDGDFIADGIPFCSLSGSQQKVIGMSIALGFMALRDSHFRLLFVDDAENIDTSHWKRFTEALKVVQEDGLIDNFIASGIKLKVPEGAKETKLKRA